MLRLFLLLLTALPSFAANLAVTNLPPMPAREFRAAWIASVGNIDWPSKAGLSTAEQQTELRAILTAAQQLKLNAVILQVRPGCDALYASKLEPWSEYLTGRMGRPPTPYYDPLEFAVKEAHARGLELHAWFNPYRVHYLHAKSTIATNHISKLKPQLVRSYGKYLWLDPSEKAVRDHVLNVILDVVKRYDIDGVHLDDYFYPYKEKDASQNWIDFPDHKNWKKYRAEGGKLEVSDWRRQNVNMLVERLYTRIKAEKAWVKFGISPFGIWRPGFPQQVSGLDPYEQLYADSKLWLNKGWLDYCSPQLYWPIKSPSQSFPLLLNWWIGENTRGRHLWPGLASGRVSSNLPPQEIGAQIDLTRKQSDGHIHWSVSSLMKNQAGLSNFLQQAVYIAPALVPASPWLDNVPPGKPLVTFKTGETNGLWRAQWSSTAKKEVRLWVVQKRKGASWSTEIVPAAQNRVEGNKGEACPDVLAITAVDRIGNLSPTSLLVTSPEPLKLSTSVSLRPPPVN